MPTGIEVIESGKCPLGGTTTMACMFCLKGHMTDCHYPKTCEEANCSHYQETNKSERYYSDPDGDGWPELEDDCAPD